MTKILFIEEAKIGYQMDNLPQDLEILLIWFFDTTEGLKIHNLPMNLRQIYVHATKKVIDNLGIDIRTPFGCSITFLSYDEIKQIFSFSYFNRKYDSWLSLEGITDIEKYGVSDVDAIFINRDVDYITIKNGSININFNHYLGYKNW